MRANKFITTDCQGHAELLRMLSVFTQKFRLFYGRIQLIPENADKVFLAACVLHNYLRNDVNVENCVIENTDALSQFS
jgi:hypothetical protein